MKRKTKIKLLILLITAILLFPFTQGRWKLSKGVTVENIRKLKYEMPEKEVIKLLGKPFSVVVTERDKEGKPIRYYYKFAKEIPYSRWYPMLCVYIEDGKLVRVYAKRIYSFGEEGLYFLYKVKNELYNYYYENESGLYQWECSLFEKSFPHSKK